MPKTLKERLLNKIKILKNECWEWQGTKCSGKRKYGLLFTKNKGELAHRISYKIFVGDIPNGLNVCHTCDNPPCINPDHLFLGTDTDNHNDCVSKNRHPHGITHGKAKLTEDQVRQIRLLGDEGMPWDEINRKFGIKSSRGICKRRTWKHI